MVVRTHWWEEEDGVGGLVIMVNRGGWLYELKREFKSWSVRLEWLVMVVQVGYQCGRLCLWKFSALGWLR